ncbi:MAG: trimethylamine corrinoid protein 2 [Verrucomicrobia bacterium]|nr:trimethylamine corrinoid protein 2 [Verrucomicrobiota bacterium]MDA1088236.1 trimethylamine corrinoid protein 2 [Verrucomicrobiota bacterium]
MFELKPDFEEVLNRYESWWDCAVVDRPLVSMTFALPQSERVKVPQKQHATFRERWTDTEHIVAQTEARLRNTAHFADSLPVAWPNLGPEVFSAFYGCEMEYGAHTAWSKSILTDWSDESVEKLRLDKSSFYFHKLIEMTEAFIEAGKGKFIVGYTDLHGGGDAIAAFRDPQELLIDTMEHPNDIKRLCDRITADLLEVYDHFHEILSAAGMPSTTWLPATCKGKYYVPSNDFSCMISDAAFEELFVPGIIRECQHMDRCIYHLDGPQALRYLDRLLEIPEIHAIQWVPGAGQDYWADWIEVYQRIQNKKKALQLPAVPLEDLDRLFEVLSPQGVWISSVPGVSSQQEAEAALHKIAKWTKRQ